MSLPLRPPLITWVSGETSLITSYVVASSRVNSTGSGPVVQYFWALGSFQTSTKSTLPSTCRMTSRTKPAQRASSASVRGGWRTVPLGSSRAQRGMVMRRSRTCRPASRAAEMTRSIPSKRYGIPSTGCRARNDAVVEMTWAPASLASVTSAPTSSSLSWGCVGLPVAACTPRSISGASPVSKQSSATGALDVGSPGAVVGARGPGVSWPARVEVQTPTPTMSATRATAPTTWGAIRPASGAPQGERRLPVQPAEGLAQPRHRQDDLDGHRDQPAHAETDRATDDGADRGAGDLDQESRAGQLGGQAVAPLRAPQRHEVVLEAHPQPGGHQQRQDRPRLGRVVAAEDEQDGLAQHPGAHAQQGAQEQRGGQGLLHALAELLGRDIGTVCEQCDR